MSISQLVIHVSGAPGSGKTTMGNQLKRAFGNKIVVKDLDDLRDSFITDFYKGRRWTFIDESAYQQYIDRFVEVHRAKPIIFVGLNDNTRYGKNKRLYYNLHAQHGYYVDVADDTLVRQKYGRLLDMMRTDKNIVQDLVGNNKRFLDKIIKEIRNSCSIPLTEKTSNRLKNYYTKQSYKYGVYRHL